MNVSRRAGAARLDAVLYLAAAVSYIGLGIYHKWLLNWVVGPLWLIAWLQLVPALGRIVTRRRERPERPGPQAAPHSHCQERRS